MAAKKHKLSTAQLPLQRQFAFVDTGRVHDLQAIFDKLNARYFRNRLKGYTIKWGQRRKLRPKNYIVFGTIQETDRIIKIHPLLDRACVPALFVEYVIYHEMCHAVVRDLYDSAGRRIVHHRKFYDRERRYRFFRRAKTWEVENLGKFLR